MYAKKNKSKKNDFITVTGPVMQKKSAVKQCFGFVDNRTEAVAQRKMKTRVSNTHERPNDQDKPIQRLLIHTGDAAIGNDGASGYRTGEKNLISAGELQEQMLSLKEKYGDVSVDVSELNGKSFAEKKMWDSGINYLLGHFEPERDFFLGENIAALSEKIKKMGCQNIQYW